MPKKTKQKIINNIMKKIIVSLGLVVTTSLLSVAQKKADTVIVKFGESSKVIFTIQDKKDLETLKYYNFQALMEDMIAKLDKRDSTNIEKPAAAYLKDTVRENMQNETVAETNEEWPTEADRKRYRGNDWPSEKNNRTYSRHSRKDYRRRTYSSFNIDLGTNNYLSNGSFPDQSNSVYSVRPWGSWYVGLSSIQRTRLANKLFIEWGVGVSWYNFKFQSDKVQMSRDDNGVYFNLDTRDFDFTKSKLTVAHLNASLVPMLDLGSNSRKPGLFSGHHSRSFRIGAGPYVGYRIDSYAKQVYEQGGDKKKEHNHNSYYLNNIRYGARLQFGIRGTDFFFNYDLNDLFVANKGPQLNAFSFGVTF
jgi:hypothetical protein